MPTLITYTLKIIFTGLIAFVPTASDLTVLLVDPKTVTGTGQSCTNADHLATFTTLLSHFVPGHAPPQGSYWIAPRSDGDQDAVIPLKDRTVTLGNLTPRTAFSQRTAMFRDTELPHWFIPGHGADVRWAVAASKIVPQAYVKSNVISQHYGLSAMVTLNQGTMATSSLIRDDSGDYITWTFAQNGLPKAQIQALADQVTVEMPFTYDGVTPPVVFTLVSFDGNTTLRLELFPNPGETVIEVSISNLPQAVPSPADQHFHCFCYLVQNAGAGCADPTHPGSIRASGIFCPMTTLLPAQ